MVQKKHLITPGFEESNREEPQNVHELPQIIKWVVEFETPDGKLVRQQLRKVILDQVGPVFYYNTVYHSPIWSSYIPITREQYFILQKLRELENSDLQQGRLSRDAKGRIPKVHLYRSGYWAWTSECKIASKDGLVVVPKLPYGLYRGSLIQSHDHLVLISDPLEAKALNEAGIAAIAPPSSTNRKTFKEIAEAFTGKTITFYLYKYRNPKENKYWCDVWGILGKHAKEGRFYEGDPPTELTFKLQLDAKVLLDKVLAIPPLAKPGKIAKRPVGRPVIAPSTERHRIVEAVTAGYKTHKEMAKSAHISKGKVRILLEEAVKAGELIKEPRSAHNMPDVYRVPVKGKLLKLF